MLRVEHLTKVYPNGTQALTDVSFEVYSGEVFGFLGPNGAGKTTTIKMIVGLLQPTSGTVNVSGFDVQKQPLQAKAASGYVPDTPNLYPKLSGRELLRFVGDLYEMDRQQVERRVDELLDAALTLEPTQWPALLDEQCSGEHPSSGNPRARRKIGSVFFKCQTSKFERGAVCPDKAELDAPGDHRSG